MIPCHVCGVDAATNWVKGYPTAPDSRKFALCPLHDTEENRSKVLVAWNLSILKEVRGLTEQAARRSGGAKLLTVSFSGGGSLSLPCVSCAPTEHETLKVETPNGETVFFPLKQLKQYTVSPSGAVQGKAEQSAFPAKK